MRTRSELHSPVDRRRFLKLLGAATAPLLSLACRSRIEAQHVSGSALAADPEYTQFNLPRVDTLGSTRSASSSTRPDMRIPISVQRPLPGRRVIADDREACSISRPLAIRTGLALHDQVRLIRRPGEFALYTVAQINDEDDEDTVRVGRKGRARLGRAECFSGQLATRVTATGLDPEQAEARGELLESLMDDGRHNQLVICAPHGGLIEALTAEQAVLTRELLGRRASAWICRGYRRGGGAFDRWHISSTRLSPRSFPGLAAIADRGFGYALSYHGMEREGVLLGGSVSTEVKELVRDAIRETVGDRRLRVTIADAGHRHGARSGENFVNWLTAGGQGGLQIEQGPNTRRRHWRELSQAVAQTFERLV